MQKIDIDHKHITFTFLTYNMCDIIDKPTKE